MRSPSSAVYRFGAFELDLRSGELRKNGIKQKIQDQPFNVLVKLLDHTGEVVTREELQRALWPADTFVSFETGLNTAIKRLREVLGDSAETPTFIGTIPKCGYRFLAAVNKAEVVLPVPTNGKADVQIGDAGTPEIASQKLVPSVRRMYVLAATLALLFVIGAAFFGGKLYWHTPPAVFHRVSFRRGYIPAARFGVDSRTVIYAAAWDGRQPELFSTRSDSPESRQLGLGIANLLAISNTGQMAIARTPTTFGRIANYKGTLAQAPLAGGAARELLDDVMAADWDAAGEQMAVVRMVEGRCHLEFPVGRMLYESRGFISNMRISPNQRLVAFLDHPLWGDDRGSVMIVDVSAHVRMRSPIWETVDGLAWSSKGDEVWFTAAVSGSGSDLYAVNLAGRQRVVQRIGERLVLQDISPDGRVLVTEEDERFGIAGLSSADSKERDLSWLDYSFLTGELSADGNTIVFSEESEANGPNYAACIRKLDGSPPVRLGEGLPSGVSSDGKWVLSVRPNAPGLQLLPTGTGQMRVLDPKGIEQHWGKWFPDGKQILVRGSAPGRPERSYVESVDGSQLQPITPEGVVAFLISQDGKRVIAAGPDEEAGFSIYPVDGGQPRVLPGMEKGYSPVQWSEDGQTLYVRYGRSSAQIYRVNVSTGERSLWKVIVPADPAGLLSIDTLDIARDGQQIVYGYARITSDLYVVDGLR